MIESDRKIRAKVTLGNGRFCTLGVGLIAESTYLWVTKGLLRRVEVRNGFQ